MQPKCPFFFLMYLSFHFVQSAVHEDSELSAFPITIISATTEADWNEITYSVEFETQSKLQAKAVWFAVYKEQRYPVVFGDPTFSSSLSPQLSNENRYIARLRARKGLKELKDRNVEFAVTLDQSTITLTFDELRNDNSTTIQTFDTFEFDVSARNVFESENRSKVEFKATFDIESNANELNKDIVLSRFIVKKGNETENEVAVSEESKKLDGERSFKYNLEYDNTDPSLVLDVTQFLVTYGVSQDAVIKKMALRSEYHFWKDQQQPLIHGVALFHELDLFNYDRRPIKLAHCEAVGDVNILIGLRGKNGRPNIPPSQIYTVQINYGYFREAFGLLRYYSGNVWDYEAYCLLQ